MPEPVAAVTGASGFIGRALVAALLDGGWRVRALVRAPQAARLWGAKSPDVVVGDLGDAPALRTLVHGVDAVFHAAGVIKARTRAEFMHVNADGARAVAAALAAEGDEGRLLLISSLAAREPRLSPYAGSKRAGEDAVRAVLAPSRVTVVRPPAVYGPGDRETLAVFQAALRSPVLPVFAARDARIALVSVHDAVAEIVRMARAPSGVAEVALGGDRPEGYGWDEIVAAAGLAVGRRPRLVRLPRGALVLAGLASGALQRLDGRARILTRGKAREILHHDWSVHPAELGPERRPAEFSLSAGFADAVAWYRREGWLPAATP